MPAAKISESVKRVFLDTFTVRDVAEPLASFDGGTASAEVREFMKSNDFDVVGIRRGGSIWGVVDRNALVEGDCGQCAIPLEQVVVRPETMPLLDAVLELNRASFLLVTLLGTAGGIVTRADLQKPPVRMWLFGLVTLIEMRFMELIERHCPADEWMGYLSETRLQKANDLLAERRKYNPSVRLFDCLQLADKGQIVARDQGIRGQTLFQSRRQAEEAIRKVERLRNDLAHAQDIISQDWETIVMLSEFGSQQFSATGC